MSAPGLAATGKGRKKLIWLALLFVALYAGIVAIVFTLQRRLIYFPAKFDPKLGSIMGERAGFTPWKNNAGQIIGWKFPAIGPATGSVLIVHGNAGCAIDRGYFAKPIAAAASVDVYLLEYPGYGARDGLPSEKSFLAAAEEAFALLDPEHPIFVVSESLGTGVAAHLAKMHGSKIAGMALFVPYNNFAQLAQTKMSFLPVSLILLDRYDPEKWLKDFRGPIQFVLAEKDEVIPPKFGHRLFDSYNGPKNLEIVQGASHNSVSAKPPEWWRDVFQFFEKSLSVK